MKTSHILTTLAVVSALAVVNVAAAAEGDQALQRKALGQQGGAQLEEARQAIESNDYDAWAELTAEHPQAAKMFENVNAGNFYLMNEMHQAKEAGDMEKAKELAEELGFQPGEMAKKMNKGQFQNQMREEVKTALENRDYNAWQEAMTPPIFEHVNEGNFNAFADMHEAIQAGDKDTAEQIRAELGLPERKAPGNGMKMGQRGTGTGVGMAQNQ